MFAVTAGALHDRRPAARRRHAAPPSGAMSQVDRRRRDLEAADATGLPRLAQRASRGVAIAPKTNAQRVFLVGAGRLLRSDDGGATWKADHRRSAPRRRLRVYVIPANPDIVYGTNTTRYRSLDGGATFTGFKGAPGGDDPQRCGSIRPTASACSSASIRARSSRSTAADVELLVQPVDRADLPRRHRQPLSVLGLRHAAGHRRHPHAQTAATSARSLARLDSDAGMGRGLRSWPIRWIRTSSTRAARSMSQLVRLSIAAGKQWINVRPLDPAQQLGASGAALPWNRVRPAEFLVGSAT